MTTCPVCAAADAVDTVERPRLPAMQNYVHRTRESALGAVEGRLVLAVCRTCGFAWNRAFDPSLLVYDEGYDNAVPSAVMEAYYAEIVEYLAAKYALDDGLVVDVGCGDGKFLRLLCAALPATRGLGIDPALEQDCCEQDGRVRLVKGVFGADAVPEPPALVVSRHVLEHVPQPVEFLETIGAAVSAFGPRPCFLEVPDLRWIVEHGAFWDFCYEHCNYFTSESFAAALRRAGFGQVSARTGFGSQYLWLEAESSSAEEVTLVGSVASELAERLVAHAAEESERIASMRMRLAELKRDGFAIVVWGMATKGVLFSILVDPDSSLIDDCVDVNENKQGCFVPLTGHPISAPAVLRERAGSPVAVVVMNANYRDEIESTCRALGVDASFVGVDEPVRRP